MIDKAYWGQGLGTEAARGVLGLTRLLCSIDQDNGASIRVAEKIGMGFEKERRDEKGPFWLYAIQK